jgi:hypothetical protein
LDFKPVDNFVDSVDKYKEERVKKNFKKSVDERIMA